MEDFGNGQSNNIFPGLDNETISAMQSVQQNWNDDFQNGNSTDLGGVAVGISNSLQLIDSIITPKLISYTTSYITYILTSYLQESTVEMLSFDASEIISYSAYVTPKFLLTTGAIMNELLKPKEDISEEQIKKADDENNKAINDAISKGVEQVSTKVSEQLEKINPTIKEIAKYSQMGPVWIKSKMDVAIKKIIEPGIKAITVGKNAVNKQKEDMIKSLGQKMGERLAEDTNEGVKKTLKEKIDKQNKEKQKSIAKAKTNVINAKLKIMALVGA